MSKRQDLVPIGARLYRVTMRNANGQMVVDEYRDFRQAVGAIEDAVGTRERTPWTIEEKGLATMETTDSRGKPVRVLLAHYERATPPDGAWNELEHE